MDAATHQSNSTLDSAHRSGERALIGGILLPVGRVAGHAPVAVRSSEFTRE